MIEQWMAEYEKNLLAVVIADWEKPTDKQEYSFNTGLVPTVAAKMREAFIKGSYNKDGKAIKLTCKHFGVAHTYRAIKAFLASEVKA